MKKYNRSIGFHRVGNGGIKYFIFIISIINRQYTRSNPFSFSIPNRVENIPRKLSRPQRFKTEVRLYDDLPRKQHANLIRLRTGHCWLNSYLYRHSTIIDDPACDYGRGVENVKLLCKKYEGPRKELKKKVGGRNMRTENLLGDPKLVKSWKSRGNRKI